MPRKRFENVGIKVGVSLFFLPSALILLFPAKDIGRLVSKPPAFNVPNSVVAGDTLSWKDTGGIASLRLNGHPLLRLTKPEPMYLGAADRTGPATVSFDVVYANEDLKMGQRIKRFFTLKTKHPEVPYFSKVVKVELPNLEEDADESGARNPASQNAASLNEGRELEPNLRPLFAKTEGEPKLSCWKTPEMKLQEPPPTLPGRKPTKRRPTFNVTSAGPGEVVFAGEGNPQEKVVVLYHGGGIFTRYLNLKDFRVRKGEKIKAGQELGSMVFASQKEASHAEPQWEVRWGTTAVTPPSFLALSSRLCGST